MKLQTQIPLKPVTQNTIDYNSKIVLFGSCFSEYIGAKFKDSKFSSFSNPLGILFHVKAIETLIEKSVSECFFTENDVFQLNEQFQCFSAHSKLNRIEATSLVSDLNTALSQTKTALQSATHIVITLGTSWVYKHVVSNRIVANCHKVPQKEFEKVLLSVDEVSASLQKCIQYIQTINTKVQFIFTVSPVRHLKDGFVENTLSKSHLISAVHSVVNSTQNTSYFPSYEIVMDQLRDYRFYNEDLLHPNQTAINYIWKQFLGIWTTLKTQTIIKEVDTIQKGLHHKPFNENSEAYKRFLETINHKKEVLQKTHHIKF